MVRTEDNGPVDATTFPQTNTVRKDIKLESRVCPFQATGQTTTVPTGRQTKRGMQESTLESTSALTTQTRVISQLAQE